MKNTPLGRLLGIHPFIRPCPQGRRDLDRDGYVMVPGLVWGLLFRFSDRPYRTIMGLLPGGLRWQLGQWCQALPFSASQQRRAGLESQLLGLPPRENTLVLAFLRFYLLQRTEPAAATKLCERAGAVNKKRHRCGSNATIVFESFTFT